ncbi:MAG: lipopolysaccharide kinase InaA family protein [Candidatus Micrarchaeia archaeon]
MVKTEKWENSERFVFKLEPPFDRGKLRELLEEKGHYLLPDSRTGKHQEVELMLAGDSSHRVFPVNVVDDPKKPKTTIKLVIKPHLSSEKLTNEAKALKKIRTFEPKINAVRVVGCVFEKYRKGEKKKPGKKYRRGWLITHLKEGAIPLLAINWKTLRIADKKHTLNRVAEFIAHLHSKNTILGDLRAKNLLIKLGTSKTVNSKKNPFPHFYLVDLENAKTNAASEKEKAKDIRKLTTDFTKIRGLVKKRQFNEFFLRPYQTEYARLTKKRKH